MVKKVPIRVLPTKGSWGWLGLAGYVVAFDVLSQETLSAAFTTAVTCPRRRPWVVASTAYLVLHLYHGIPDRYDPLRRLDRLMR
jgi:hypothetical protein